MLDNLDQCRNADVNFKQWGIIKKKTDRLLLDQTCDEML
jgi:hypothetical protein